MIVGTPSVVYNSVFGFMLFTINSIDLLPPLPALRCGSTSRMLPSMAQNTRVANKLLLYVVLSSARQIVEMLWSHQGTREMCLYGEPLGTTTNLHGR